MFELTALPASVAGLTALESLALRSTPLVMPDLGRALATLPRLTRLALERYTDLALPREIAELASLEQLTLGGCVRATLPDPFELPPRLAVFNTPRGALVEPARLAKLFPPRASPHSRGPTVVAGSSLIGCTVRSTVHHFAG